MSIFKEPLGLKLLRKPHLPSAPPISNDRINTNTVMSSFKTVCLNATLKFVKNETQLILQYPDVSTEQADYIKHMISQCLSCTSSDSTPGGRGMLDPLAEAMRIFSRKYSFELRDNSSKTDMKKLYLEKIPKEKDIHQDAKEQDITTTSIQKSSPPKKSKKLGSLQASLGSVKSQFTINAMNELLDFLKSTEETKIFTKLSCDEQNIILNWDSVIHRNEIVSTFCVKDQMLLDDIRTYLEDCRFTVEITSKTVSPINRTVTFTKKKKKQKIKNAHAKTVADQMYPDLFDHLVSLSKTTEKQDKKVEQFISKTKSLSNEWMTNALSQLNNFIIDDAEASSIFPFVNEEQVEFLTQWQTVLAIEEVIEKYDAKVQLILREVKKNMESKMSWLRVNTACSKLRNDNTRHMTFSKIPYYGDNTTKQMKTKTEPKVTNKEIAKSNQKEEIKSKNVEPDKCIQQTIPKSSSVTSLPVSKSVVSERERPKSAIGNSKAKLIEALSQPLVSERGLKMMKNMGWEGGALGLRGEGIVEPIALPLDLKKGAGLGCEKIETKQPKQTTNFTIDTNLNGDINRVVLNYIPGSLETKRGFLQTILDMLEDFTMASEVVFMNQLQKKLWTFLKESVILMNQRKKFTNEVQILSEISQKISNKLSNTKTIITVCWGASKKNVLFVQSNTKYQPVDIKKWCAVINIDSSKVPEHIMDSSKVTESVNINNNKLVVGETFRCYVLAQILEFCQEKHSIDQVTDSISKEVQLKGTMLPKQMSFIKDLIKRLNGKSRASSECKKEQAIFADILSVMTNFTLHVEFPENTNDNKANLNKIIRFQKIFKDKYILKKDIHTVTSENNTKTEKRDVINKKIDQDINIKTAKENNLGTKSIKNEIIKSDAKRRTTFTTDTFDENCLFERQSPIDDTNELKIEKLLSRQDQSKPMDDQAATKHDQSTPKKDENTLKNKLNTDKDVPLKLPIHKNTIVDCRLPNEKVIDEETKETVQYLFLKKEVKEYDLDKPIVTKLDNEQRKNTEERETIANLDDDIHNLSLKDESETQMSEHLAKLTEEITGLCLELKQSSKQDSKRPISNPATPIRARKVRKCEKFFRKIKITPKNYPQTKISDETAAEIQKSILKSIDYTEELPLLQCHGIQDGGIIYSCHTEKSLNFLLQTLKDYHIAMTEESEHFCYKMTVKINSFVKENVEDIFDRLETYNMSLDTKNWKVLDITRGSDHVILSIDIDENSYNVIYREKFRLYTGIDLAKFSILWECDN